MKYRFVCYMKPEASVVDEEKEYAETDDFPGKFSNYSSVVLEGMEVGEKDFHKIADIFYTRGLDVCVISHGMEYVFRSNIFRTLLNNGIPWDSIIKYSLSSSIVKE